MASSSSSASEYTSPAACSSPSACSSPATSSSQAASYSEAYASAGVDITAGYKAVELMKSHIVRTKTPGVLEGIGGFGGLFAPDLSGMTQPVLVSGTDGVGTKLKIAFLMDKHDTVGIDCVAMCVNDVICCGAKPLFFLDYIACGKNSPERIASIVKGVCDGCVQAGAALIGGETAEMPGFYPQDEYDLAGYCTGIVNRDDIIDHDATCAGDVIIALPSSGVHSNGFSLVRKVFGIDNSNSSSTTACNSSSSCTNLTTYVDELQMSLGEALLTPTRIYVKPVLELLKNVTVHGISHITGGGFYENIPRSIPEGKCAVIEKKAVRILPVFHLIAEKGHICERDMFNTFNMGVGMSITVPQDEADKALSILHDCGEDAYIIGEIREGTEKIQLL